MDDLTWKTETRKIKDLKQNPKNPRKLNKHEAKHIQQSLTKFGQADPVIINQDNTIIGGHQRVKILKKMGVKEVQVNVPSRALEDKEADELNIRLNKNSGEWDFDILANEWEIPDLLSWGFTEDELNIDVEVIEGSAEGEEEKKQDNTVECPSCGYVLKK